MHIARRAANFHHNGLYLRHGVMVGGHINHNNNNNLWLSKTHIVVSKNMSTFLVSLPCTDSNGKVLEAAKVVPESQRNTAGSNHLVPVRVKIPNYLDFLTPDKLLSFRPFNEWLQALTNPEKGILKGSTGPKNQSIVKYRLTDIEIQSADLFGTGKLGFIKLKSSVLDPNDRPIPGIVFLRGGASAMLVFVTPLSDTDEESAKLKYPQQDKVQAHKDIDSADADSLVVMVTQPRVPIGSYGELEIPAGMIDEGSFVGSAAKELKEECGLEFEQHELIDLTSPLGGGIYTTGGGSDEQISIFFCRKSMTHPEIQCIQQHMHGNKKENEKIHVSFVPYKDLAYATRDSKTIMAVTLYEAWKKSHAQKL